MMSCTRISVLMLAATTLAASGCGKSANTTIVQTQPTAVQSTSATSANPEPANAITRPRLISKADAICKQLTARRALIKINTAQDLARAGTEMAAYEQRMLVELNKLVPPASLTSDWKQIVADVQTLAADTAKIGESAKSNSIDSATIRTLNRARAGVERHGLAIARNDGFHNCSRDI